MSPAKVRPEYARMMKEARRGAFDVIVVWAIDRFGRSMIGNVSDVLELDRVGVQVVSVRESWLDTGSPVRTLLLAISSVAGRTGAGPHRREDEGRDGSGTETRESSRPTSCTTR